MMAPDPGCGHAISGEKWTGPICGLWRGLSVYFLFFYFLFFKMFFFLFFFFDVDEKQTGTFGVLWFYVVLLVVLLIVRKKNPKFQIL